MSKRPVRSAPSRAADPVALFASAVDLPAAVGATLPDWIRIAPNGALNCRDGRTYTLDPKALVARFNADGVEIPVDLGHATVRGNDAPALGWIDQLDARGDGLWGKVREWLEGGRAVLAARTHRYVSPAFHYNDEGAATWLHSVALVAAPALSMPAVLAAGGAAGEVGDFAVALGLDIGATRATCLAALAELKAGAVPLPLHEVAIAQLAATTAELRTLKAERQAGKVEALIEGALKEMKIVPAERETYAELAASEHGFRTVERLFASMTPVLRPSSLERRQAVVGHRDRSPAALAAAAKDLMAEHERKGLPKLDFADAVHAVARLTPLD